jgi:hypothetical protein
VSDTRSSEQALRPCPWCGVSPEKNRYGYYHLGEESTSIECRNPTCVVRPSLNQDQRHYGEWDIFEAWNRYSLPDAEGEKVVALARFFRAWWGTGIGEMPRPGVVAAAAREVGLTQWAPDHATTLTDLGRAALKLADDPIK